jgi:hypothetical protein
VILDLDTDGHGRPMGCLQADQEHVTEFGDWLELLRLLEACIDRAKTGAGRVAAGESKDRETTR